MITSLDRTHAGFYRCIVRNRMGALLQRQTEVQVACEYRVTRGRAGVQWERGPHPPATLPLCSSALTGQDSSSAADGTEAWG